MPQSITVNTSAKQVMKEAGATLEVRFHGMRQYAFRVWVAEKLIRLAALLMWCDIDFQFSDADGDT